MKVLVTGARGFAGRHLMSHIFATTDWDIVVTDTDLTSPLDGQFDDFVGDVDVVFHLAAKSDVQHAIDSPVSHVRDNVDMTLNMLEWARARPLTHFIQVSTNEVYGPTRSSAGSREWDSIVPTTPYSASKAAQEALAAAWWRTYDVPTVIVNTQHLFGEGQPRRRFIPTVVDHILDDRPVPLIGEEELGVWTATNRRWLHAQDFADALIWLVKRGDPAPNTYMRPDRWHVAGDEVDCLSLAMRIANLLERPLNVSWLASPRAGYEQHYTLDTTKLDSVGWSPPLGLSAGIERTVEWAVRTYRGANEANSM